MTNEIDAAVGTTEDAIIANLVQLFELCERHGFDLSDLFENARGIFEGDPSGR